MKPRFNLPFTAVLLTLGVASILLGCSTSRKSPTQPGQSDEQQAQVMLTQIEHGRAQNEAIRAAIEPYVLVNNGRFVLLPAVTQTHIDATILGAVRSHLDELNTLAAKGDISIQGDRSVQPLREAVPAATQACWRGVRSHWWGLEVGMSGQDISAMLSAWRGAGGCASVSATLLSIPGAGPFMGTLSYVYCNFLATYLSVFNCCICHGSCEIITIYYWALPTPFPNCQ